MSAANTPQPMPALSGLPTSLSGCASCTADRSRRSTHGFGRLPSSSGRDGVTTGRGLANITAIWGVCMDNDGGDLSAEEFAAMFPHLMDLFGDDQFVWLANKDIEDKDPFGGTE
jgi:hypothetical protein